MDLQAFDTRTAANEGRPCPLRDPAGKATDVVLTLYGADSDRYRQAVQEAADRRLAKGRDGLTSLTSAEMYEESLDRLVRCTGGWSGLTEKGKPLAFSGEAARRLYEAAPAVREQAQEFIHARSHFSPPSKPD